MTAGPEQLEQLELADGKGSKNGFIRCLNADGLTLREGLPDLDLAGEITVGDEIAMAGFGGNVGWSGAVTGMAAVKDGNLKTSVAFSGDCSTWDGVLKSNQYGQAKIISSFCKLSFDLPCFVSSQVQFSKT